MSDLEFIYLNLGFCFLWSLPLLVIVLRIVFCTGRSSITWVVLACFAVYYVVIFTVTPRYVSPYLQSYMEAVQVCTFKQILKRD